MTTVSLRASFIGVDVGHITLRSHAVVARNDEDGNLELLRLVLPDSRNRKQQELDKAHLNGKQDTALKAPLNQIKRALRSGDREEQRRVQHELKYKISRADHSCRKKLEEQLEQNRRCGARGTAGGDQRQADELNPSSQQT